MLKKLGWALPPLIWTKSKRRTAFFRDLFPLTVLSNTGDTVCLIQDDTDQYICPTSTSLTCDLDRCPLQGPLIAPVKEAELTGVRRIIYTLFTVKMKFPPYFHMVILASFTQQPFAPGQVIIGGWDDTGNLESVEVFPRPPSDACFIPNLPQARKGHSLSLLSDGSLVVCGGLDRSCIYWVAGNTTWTPIFTTRHAFYSKYYVSYQ